jgi:uncharacterized protein YceK
MKKHGPLIVLLAVTVPLSGCGTAINLCRGSPYLVPADPHTNPTGKPEIYGGVYEDAILAWKLLTDSPSDSYPVADRVAELLVYAPGVLCIDLPLSGVADTLTLPLTVRSALHENEPHPHATPKEQDQSGDGQNKNAERNWNDPAADRHPRASSTLLTPGFTSCLSSRRAGYAPCRTWC